MHQQAVAEQVSIDQLQRFDPLALSPLVRNRSGYFFTKRLLDLILASLALLISAPLLIIIALCILVDSGWPVIFSQTRIGAKRWIRDGYGYWQRSKFTCYKFRSMVKDADALVHKAYIEAYVSGCVEASGETEVKYKLNNDARVTRVGRILRKTSLDELPQLVNVIRGDMSLVGPRPDVPYAVKCYQPWQYGRLAALPGITGLWQTHGRCNVSFDEMVRMDIEYINNQSFWLDLKILLLTIPAVLSGEGAV